MLPAMEEAEVVVSVTVVERMGAAGRVIPIYRPPPPRSFDRRSLPLYGSGPGQSDDIAFIVVDLQSPFSRAAD
jgi:hypothetical protein